MTELVKYDERVFTKTGLILPENLPFEDWLSLAPKLRCIRDASLWWWGDYINFGEKRYGEVYAQALEESDYAYGTLANASYISRQFEFSRRRENLPLCFHQEVASLKPEDQDKLLNECEQEGWTQRELRGEARKTKKIFTIKEMPMGVYDLVYCDPPWQYDFAETDNRKIENQYPTMAVDEICNIKLPKIADDALLLMWATAPKLTESLKVLDSWGFTYKTHGIWDKEKIGMGYWFRGQHELLIIATRGNFSPPTPDNRNSSIFREERTKHSTKPLFFYDWIEKSFPDSKKIELFARTKHSDLWEVWGNE